MPRRPRHTVPRCAAASGGPSRGPDTEPASPERGGRARRACRHADRADSVGTGSSDPAMPARRAITHRAAPACAGRREERPRRAGLEARRVTTRRIVASPADPGHGRVDRTRTTEPLPRCRTQTARSLPARGRIDRLRGGNKHEIEASFAGACELAPPAPQADSPLEPRSHREGPASAPGPRSRPSSRYTRRPAGSGRPGSDPNSRLGPWQDRRRCGTAPRLDPETARGRALRFERAAPRIARLVHAVRPPQLRRSVRHDQRRAERRGRPRGRGLRWRTEGSYIRQR